MRYCLSHLSDGVLLRDLTALVANDRSTTAELLAHLAEVDARQLYRPAAFPSMHAYCVEELRMSEDEACRRIRAARAARDFPAILPALADGRLHLSAVVLLAPHLTSENAAGLLEDAAHRSRAGVRQLLAERFPQADLPTRVEPLAEPAPRLSLANAPGSPRMAGTPAAQLGVSSAPARMQDPVILGQLIPLAPRRYGLQVTIPQETHDKLRYAQALLGHVLPSKDLATLLERALDALIRELERRKFAPGARAHGGARRRSGTRYIPAAVRCAVWERDHGQCTFVSERGRRCPERTKLEFDHVDPFARGGEATVERMRLRCRSHNQFEAERAYGAGFMERKREEARQRVAGRRVAAGPHENGEGRASAADTEIRAPRPADETAGGIGPSGPDQVVEQDVFECLRALRIPAEAARRAAAQSTAVADASLDERVRAALSFHGRARFPTARPAKFGPGTPM